MVRALAPALFVKIVDACHSGVSYIKSGENLDDYLKTASVRFREVYFLYSSQSSEVSWTSGSLSAFTKSILLAIADQDSGSIRYRDLMSAASDYFEASGQQRPLFVTQADYTQVFCDASTGMQAIVKGFLPSLPTSPTPAPVLPPAKGASLIDRIRDVESKFCTREEALQMLERFGQALSGFSLSGEIAEIFDLQVSFSQELPAETVSIGNWLKKHGNRVFFAKPTFRIETYKKIVSVPTQPTYYLSGRKPLSEIFRQIPAETERTTIDATRQVISGFQHTVALPFSEIALHLTPKFRAVTPLKFHVIPLLSATDLLAFWSMREFAYSDWDTVQPQTEPLIWDNSEAPLKNDEGVLALSHQVLDRFNSLVVSIMKAGWPSPNDGELSD